MLTILKSRFINPIAMELFKVGECVPDVIFPITLFSKKISFSSLGIPLSKTKKAAIENFPFSISEPFIYL